MGHFDGFQPLDISIHALREEGDLRYAVLGLFGQFLPTPSVRRATDAVGPADRGLIISTHALREEGDPYSASSSVRAIFLPTPSARRATFLYPGLKLQSRRFLPTPSARRATW